MSAPTGRPPAAADVFLAGYDAFRAAFLDAACACGARIETLPIAARGPAGQPLAIETAWIGAPRPRRALMILSGTHGDEAPAGAAGQLQALREDLDLLAPPPEGALILVFAVNPYGFAWGRRQNEDNVDLNRNFLDWSRPPPVRPEYDAIAPLLNPTTWDDPGQTEFLAAAGALLAEKGEAWVQARLTEGQYAHPRGLYYGGAGPAEANGLLRAFVARALDGVQEAFLIDVHTGMGAYGDHILLSSHDAACPRTAWILRHFPPARVSVPYGGDDRWPAVSGKMGAALADAAAPAVVRSVSLEFGTFEGARMILAERAENWLHHYGDRASAMAAAILAEKARTAIPDDPVWRRRVLAGCRAVFADAWRALFAADGLVAPQA